MAFTTPLCLPKIRIAIVYEGTVIMNFAVAFSAMTAMILLAGTAAPAARAGVDFPGPKPGSAKATVKGGMAKLENEVISMTWNISRDDLVPGILTNKITGEKFPQGGTRLFQLSTKEPVKVPETTAHRVGISLGADKVYVYAAKGNGVPMPLVTFPRAKFPGAPKLLRLGKLNLKAQPVDHYDPGVAGTCTISNLVVSAAGAAPVAIPATGWITRQSTRPGTAVEATAAQIRITAAANSAAAAEREVPAGATEFFGTIDKQTDAGMSWGPALALVWEDGKFILISLRDGKAAVFNVTSPAGEQMLTAKANPYPAFDLASGKDFKLAGPVTASPLKANPKGIRVAERIGGQQLTATFTNARTGLSVLWQAELRDGSNYLRQNFSIQTVGPAVALYGVELADLRVSGLAAVGTCPGSPVAGRGCFFGLEMPGALNLIQPDSARIGLECKLEVAAQQPYAFATVAGVCPDGQLRRGFLFYIERERARPSAPFLHYNCWYDLGYGVSEKSMLDVVAQFDAELVQKRGVPVKSYLVDDGWDNPGKGLWIENERTFPEGFRGMKAKMDKTGSHLGIWISPLGGYGGDKERTEHARKMGLIPAGSALDLAQPAYKAWFQNRCLQLMREGGVNAFKWDRAGNGVSPHFMALLDIARNLRQENPELFVNVTVGTWPSPFWLNHVDSTWRISGGDVGWTGKGRDPGNKYDRETWLTYRDGHCRRAFVEVAPLYPLNSAMHHGIVHGRDFQGGSIGKSNPPDLKNEARSYFGNGASLQELYLTPSMMTPDSWDKVAEAAKWGAAHAGILVDSHWVGGDPLKLEPYGYAAWSPQGATLTLRNPSDKPQEISLDAATVFELPAKALQTYKLKAAYADQRVKALTLNAGKPEKLTLEPFEVLVFD